MQLLQQINFLKKTNSPRRMSKEWVAMYIDRKSERKTTTREIHVDKTMFNVTHKENATLELCDNFLNDLIVKDQKTTWRNMRIKMWMKQTGTPPPPHTHIARGRKI